MNVKVFSVILVLLASFGSCTNTTSSSMQSWKAAEAKLHYYNAHSREYLLIDRRDSLIHVLIYSMNDTSFSRFVGQDKGKVGFEVQWPDQSENSVRYLSVIDDILSEKPIGFEKVDSIFFWDRISPVLDTIVFNLSDDWRLIDQTFKNKHLSQPKIPVDRLEIKTRKFSSKNSPSVFFEVIVDQTGKITNIDYSQSFGKVVLKDLIEDVEKVLLKRNIPFYSLFGRPIKVKMKVRVYITDRVTV